ncbi:MAG: cupin domain-containing protein [Haloferacaceae archaeon]
MGRVNETAVERETTERDEATFRRKRLAAAAGGEDLGCSLYELPPGERAWPYHWHAGNEEAIYVLDGTGTIRLDGEREPLRPGDYVALPAGPSSAHRVINDGDGPLRYLAVSTMRDPDVIRYPDSEKVGVFAGSPPGSDAPRSVHGYFREADAVDYWLGEDDGGEGAGDDGE